MDNLCRFCGFDFAGEAKYFIENNAVIIKFMQSLPSEVYSNVQINDRELPKNCCNVCNDKICEYVDFYDVVLNTYRKFKSALIVEQTKIGKSSLLIKPVRLQKLSDLAKYKNKQKEDKSIKSKSASVSEIYDKLKAKSSITISKFIDWDDETSEEEKEDPDSDFENSTPEKEPFTMSSDDSNWSNNEKTEGTKRQRNVVKNPQIISLENMKPNFVCVRCRGKYKSVEALRHHIKTNNECKDTNILCGECKKVFKTRRVYSKHVRDVHEKKESPVFKCSNCDEIFPRECELMNHRVICTGECNEDYSGILFKCKDCDKSFERRIDLVQHIENHTKQLLCETCGKSCKTKKAYSTHVREHLGLKPHKCTICDKRFRTNTLLQAHQHVHTGIKSFVCDTCGKTFAKRASLVYHVRLHTGEKPYSCNLCEERFTSSERLKNHLRKHRQNFYVE